jgi:hypothetical protein
MIRTQLACLLSLLLSTSSLVAAPFPFFEGKVHVPFGNHGSISVEVLDQRFLKTTDSGNPHSEEIILDLQTGRIELNTVDYTPNETRKTTILEPADQGGAYLPYRRQLTAMIGDVTWAQQNLAYLGEELQKARKPEMTAVLEYLKDFRETSDDNAPDSVALNWLPRDLRRGVSYTISVEYLARANRELLVEFSAGQWASEKKEEALVPVGEGYQTVDVVITIPETAPVNTAGLISTKLLPVGADASDKLAESYLPAVFKKALMIVSSSASFIPFNSSVAVYTNFYCPENCEIRVDIFNAAGQWITSATAPAEKPFVTHAEQFTRVLVNAPASLLPAGQDYTYYVKILPQGGTWDQYYDQMGGSFRIGN